MNNIQDKKDFCRKLLLARRREYVISEHTEAEVLENVRKVLEQCHTGFRRYDTLFIGLYWPLKREIDILKLATLLPCIALPKIFGHEMIFVKYTMGEPLEKAGQGDLMQPASTAEILPKIVIVPGIAFSIEGYRLGFGKGYYDRYFAKNKKKGMISIGICRHEDLQEYLPRAEHDHKFDYIITDKIILKL